MKKVIRIIRQLIDNTDYYIFLLDDNKIVFNVECSTKTIKGKDLYEKIYKTDTNEIVEIEIDQTSLSTEDQKCFGNYVKDLFDSINDAMIKQFNIKKE